MSSESTKDFLERVKKENGDAVSVVLAKILAENPEVDHEEAKLAAIRAVASDSESQA